MKISLNENFAVILISLVEQKYGFRGILMLFRGNFLKCKLYSP